MMWQRYFSIYQHESICYLLESFSLMNQNARLLLLQLIWHFFIFNNIVLRNITLLCVITFVTLQIRETVLTFISQNEQYQKLLETKQFKHLKQLMVSSGQPNQVKDLDYPINQKWFSFWFFFVVAFGRGCHRKGTETFLDHCSSENHMHVYVIHQVIVMLIK